MTRLKDIDVFYLFGYDCFNEKESHVNIVKRYIKKVAKGDAKFLYVEWDGGDPSSGLDPLF